MKIAVYEMYSNGGAYNIIYSCNLGIQFLN